MDYRGIIAILLASAIWSCGSRKLETREERRERGRVEETERTSETGRLSAEAECLAAALREMEWVFRKVEERDSAGNERVTTEGVARFREREEWRDSVGLEVRDTTERVREAEGVTEADTEVAAEEEKVSAAKEWKWIVWGAVAVLALAGVLFSRLRRGVPK